VRVKLVLQRLPLRRPNQNCRGCRPTVRRVFRTARLVARENRVDSNGRQITEMHRPKDRKESASISLDKLPQPKLLGPGWSLSGSWIRLSARATQVNAGQAMRFSGCSRRRNVWKFLFFPCNPVRRLSNLCPLLGVFAIFVGGAYHRCRRAS
jgi:hypothetical protein